MRGAFGSIFTLLSCFSFQHQFSSSISYQGTNTLPVVHKAIPCSTPIARQALRRACASSPLRPASLSPAVLVAGIREARPTRKASIGPQKPAVKSSKRANTKAIASTEKTPRKRAPSRSTMVKKHFYAVAVGRERGIYSTWAQCQAQVHGYAGARFKGFPTLDEARAYLQGIPLASVPTLLSSTPSLPSLWGRECSTDSYDGLPTVQERAPARRRERSPEEEAYTVVSSGADSDVDGDAEGEAPRARQRHRAEANAYDDSRTASQCDVFVDGACSNNGRGRASQAGYGGYYGDGDSRNFSMPLSPYEAHTNNRAELHAVIRALRRAITDAGMNGENVPDIRVAARAAAAGEVELPQLRVHSDSKYVIDGLTKYSKKWIGNGFTLSDGSSPVQNQDLWKELIRLRDVYNSCYASQTVGKLQVYDVLNTHNTESDGFRILHVKGHSNIHGNVMADRLAVQGAQKSWHSV